MKESRKRIKKLSCPVCNEYIDLPSYVNSLNYTGHIVCQAEDCGTVLNVTLKEDQVIKLLIDKEVKELRTDKRGIIKGKAFLKEVKSVLEK